MSSTVAELDCGNISEEDAIFDWIPTSAADNHDTLLKLSSHHRVMTGHGISRGSRNVKNLINYNVVWDVGWKKRGRRRVGGKHSPNPEPQTADLLTK